LVYLVLACSVFVIPYCIQEMYTRGVKLKTQAARDLAEAEKIRAETEKVRAETEQMQVRAELGNVSTF
jgi:hypothetical protein